jgi:hypothetical protein
MLLILIGSGVFSLILTEYTGSPGGNDVVIIVISIIVIIVLVVVVIAFVFWRR